jgi:dTDP-4-dehydrorhamnose reductase
LAPALLAEATKAAGVPLVHVSTDYVFDGQGTGFNAEDTPVAPLGVYGASKLAGELAVRSGNPRSVVVRTAWVLSPHRANFLKTMLRLAGDRDRISVVADQFGCPTSARDIAQALATIVLRMIADTGCADRRLSFRERRRDQLERPGAGDLRAQQRAAGASSPR